MNGQRIGYVRVSSLDQNPDRQLEQVPVDRTFTDKASGKDVARPALKAIFAESSANPKVAQQVAKETGIKIIDTLYGDTLGAPASEADTYLKMMVYAALVSILTNRSNACQVK